MPFLENSHDILLEALQYPKYARAEFYTKKQIESGWSKGTFLSTLREAYDHYDIDLTIKTRIAQKKNPSKIEAEIGDSLEEVSKGKVTEVYIEHSKSSKLLNRDVLNLLNEAIQESYYYGEQKQYSDIQILIVFENIIKFISYEFKSQAGLIASKHSSLLTRIAPKGFTGKDEKGQVVYLLHDYYLKGPKQVIDLYSFKCSLRKLLLNSHNPDKLKIILQPTVNKVKEIIDVWNEKIQPLETEKANAISQRRLIQFDENAENWTIWHDEYFIKFHENASHYSNYDLVKYASAGAELIATEILDSTEEPLPNLKPNPTSKLTHLLQLYFQKGCKPLNKQQVQELAKLKGLAETALLNRWGLLKRDNYRHNSKAQSIKEFIRSYDFLMLEFESSNTQAYTDVKNLYNQLKETYPDLIC